MFGLFGLDGRRTAAAGSTGDTSLRRLLVTTSLLNASWPSLVSSQLMYSLAALGCGALPRLRIPVLILIGEWDPAAMRLKDEVMAAAPTAELRVIPSGHRMHLEDPELFATTVRDYLSL